MKTPHLSRRTMLRGLGTTLALPWLEAMGQMSAQHRATGKVRSFHGDVSVMVSIWPCPRRIEKGVLLTISLTKAEKR